MGRRPVVGGGTGPRLLALALVAALGCSSRGGTVDPGSDAAVDTGGDAPIDVAIDAETDAGVDAGTNPGLDAPPADVTPDRPGADDATPVVDRPAEDAPPADAGGPTREPQPLYGPCSSDAECLAGLRCRTAAASGFPGGQCNRECTGDDACVLAGPGSAADGYCQAADREGRRYCARVCASGIDCERDGYTCLGINQGRVNAVDVCVPACNETNCGDGASCDLQTGRCRAASAPPPTGRTLGQACVADDDPARTAATVCQSGLCSPQVVRDGAGVPRQTGNNGGFCYSRCVLPRGYSTTDYWTGSALPRANCPAGGVCLPARTVAEGDLGTCFAGCTQDSDCRVSEGYACRRTVRLSATRTRTYDRGLCEPFDCAVTGAPACPAGYSCRRTTSGTSTVGDCVPAGA